MYGCDRKDDPQLCRIFPFMLSKLNPYFLFESSRFGVQKSKASTARVALFKELKTTPCVYTMESSFAGVDFGNDKGMHLTTQMLESMGRDLLRTLLIYTSLYVPPELGDIFKVKQPQVSGKQFAEDTPDLPALSISAMIVAELSENKNLIKIGNGDSTSGSDSAPSEDNLNPAELLKNLPVSDKTVKNKLKQIENDKKSPTKLPQKEVRITTKPRETPL